MHHRQHAIEFLQIAAGGFDRVTIHFSGFVNKRDDPQLGHFGDAFIRYLENAARKTAQAVALLEDDASDLDKVRRLIGQPRTSSSGAASLLLQTSNAAAYLCRFVQGEENEDKDELVETIFILQGAWRAADFAAWHVVDGIREEKYNDPDFQEVV